MKKFDKEYSTQYIKEVQYLKNKGIGYEFVKKIDGVDTFKYVKTQALFLALANFYSD